MSYDPMVARRYRVVLLSFLFVAPCVSGCAAIAPEQDVDLEVRNHVPPAAPTAVMAVAGDASATVSWQPPQGTVASYQVTASPGGLTKSCPGSSTQVTFVGLTNGTSYTFTVVASNRYGNSRPSAPSNAVTPMAKDMPPPPPPPPPSGTRWVSGYYMGYQRNLLPEAEVDVSLMTHLIVGAVEATATGGVTTDFFVDNTNGPLMARTLANRAHQAGRKAILMLGGDGYRANLYSATTAAYRATFVTNLLATMSDLGFDGIDVDWEPVLDGDKPQIIQFLKDLRQARPGIILTFPIGWVSSNSGADAWYATVAPLVDQLNFMSYGMADNWGGWVSWHHAALFGQGADHPSSVSSTATAYLAAGVPAAKLGIGVGFYGSCWRGVSTMGVPLGSGAGVVASDNAMSYANIMAQYHDPAAYRWDDVAKSGYLSFASAVGPQQCTMVSYEDPRSVGDKGAYVKQAALGGAIVWTIGQGHIATAAAGDKDPLLRALYTAIAP